MNTKIKQTTHTIFMVEPISFGFNDQTSKNNYFQKKDNFSQKEIKVQALTEFKHMVKILSNKGIDIIVVRDTPEPHTPDSIFPNNWISFHNDGRAVIYPMYAENRRAERRTDILELLKTKGFYIREILDYSVYENQNRFLEGTGSMVFDHSNKIAYASLSERTDKELFTKFCGDFDYKPVYFNARHTVKGKRLPIYHTNVMMCIASNYAVICLDAIDNIVERIAVSESIVSSGKLIIEISEEQMHQFAGNMLQVENKEGELFLIMSQCAFRSLTNSQKETLRSYNEIIPIAIPTIEKYGGGGVRCMMAEVFL
jgi:hypothetical protein